MRPLPPPGLTPNPFALRREWGFAPLCGAGTTFSGFSKDPSRPVREGNLVRERELKSSHTAGNTKGGGNSRKNRNDCLNNKFPSFFFHISLLFTVCFRLEASLPLTIYFSFIQGNPGKLDAE